MEKHFGNIEYLYGNASVQMPNGIFRKLSEEIKNKRGSTNIQQVAFAYVYLAVVSILYKYAHFVDIDNGTYMQNSDIKELLGYNRITKSIDKIIKKGGVLDELGLTSTTKDYPIRFEEHPTETINEICLRDFVGISEMNANDYNYNSIQNIVKNRNYEVKEPLFLTTGYDNNDYGTLYSMENTHQIRLRELLCLLFDAETNNIDIMLYFFFKAKCKGFKENMRAIALYKIIFEVGIDKTAFYNHLNILKEKGYIAVVHKGWKMPTERGSGDMEANEYYFKGVD